ncbi:MAG: zinc-dependent metalloprotease [Niastella sp.]|nr:zinc-dependent metalloprotease [Niastella sp.]
MFTNKRKVIPIVLSAGLLVAINVHGQQRQKVPEVKKADTTAAATRADTTRKPAVLIRPYKDVITADVKTRNGFLTVHQKEDKYYFEVPNGILGRDILIVGRVSKAAAEMRNNLNGYAGDQIGETVFRFEKGNGKKIFLRRVSFMEYNGDSTKPMFGSVEKNNVMAIVMAFPVISFKPDSSAVVVDVTDFLNGDNDILYFQGKAYKDRAGVGAQLNDRSYLDYVRPFDSNIEIRAVKTYSAGTNPAASSYTMELNSSLVLLPEKPMQPRLADKRVGYFSVGYRDFDANPQGVADKIMVKRWRLEPRPEDVEKYKRGELVEPVKPIVFYIDPTTPKKWIPYLIQGVNDWQNAFERAGFKNAIIGREAPSREEDSTWSIDDARHSAIIYRASAIPNAMGPSVSDPRSGEILESHIFWYHNVMSLLHAWYFAQCGATDARVLQPELDDDLMGKLIRFVAAHEIGHTLGLMHNFGSSSTVPVEKLRDKIWVEWHGHTPSIMDYARFNYVAQPEDHIGEAGLFPRINDYDKWAIEWGYRWRPEFSNEQAEQKALAKIVSDSLQKNHRLWFGSEADYYDARSQSEAIGDDAVKAGEYGLKNLKRLMPGVVKWSSTPYEDFRRPLNFVRAIFDQYILYMGHAMANVGSIEKTEKIGIDAGAVYAPRGYAAQKEAAAFLNKHLFETPQWLNNPDISAKWTFNFAGEINKLQTEALASLLSRQRLMRLLWAEQVYNENQSIKTYTVSALLEDLTKGICAEIYAGKNIDAYRRNLQKAYVSRMLQVAYPAVRENDFSDMLIPWSYLVAYSDIPSLAKDGARQLQAQIRKTLDSPTLNKATRLHLQELHTQLTARFTAERKGEK